MVLAVDDEPSHAVTNVVGAAWPAVAAWPAMVAADAKPGPSPAGRP
jgi:hypothetical protein